MEAVRRRSRPDNRPGGLYRSRGRLAASVFAAFGLFMIGWTGLAANAAVVQRAAPAGPAAPVGLAASARLAGLAGLAGSAGLAGRTASAELAALGDRANRAAGQRPAKHTP